MNTLARRYARAFFRAARSLPKRLRSGKDIDPRGAAVPSFYADSANNLTDTAPPLCPGRAPMEVLRTLRARRRVQTSVGRLLFEACDH